MKPDTVWQLTWRENQVAALVAEGLTNREIAGRLAIGEQTVKTHVSRILWKLGVANRHDVQLLWPNEQKENNHVERDH